MFEELTRRWWIVAARGLVSVLVGVGLFTARIETLWMLVSWFGVLALADGIFAAGAGLAIGWMPIFLEGVLGMLVGAFTYIFPDAVRLWFVPLVVAWAIVTGALALLGALGLHRRAPAEIVGAWLLGLDGLVSIVFALLFSVRPALGNLTGIVGAYALVSGGLLVAFAMNARTWPRFVARPA
jgi:uncharacterized membrane protein HdeD (DUF308 family)